MEISDLIIDTGIDPFDDAGFFNFEVRTPSGKEYGVTYKQVGEDKFDPSCYRVCAVYKWKDPSLGEDISTKGIKSELREINSELVGYGHLAGNLFRHVLAKHAGNNNVNPKAPDEGNGPRLGFGLVQEN